MTSKGCQYRSPFSYQFLKKTPVLMLPSHLDSQEETEGKPKPRMNHVSGGVVASPTPIFGTFLDSIRTILTSNNTFDSNAAVIQPDEPPPTMTIDRIFLTQPSPAQSLASFSTQVSS